MGLMKVEHFWCCWTVRTGTLLLGNITWFGCALNLTALLYTYDLIFPSEADRAPFQAVIGMQIAANCIAIVLSGCLVIGVVYKKPNFMLPYMVVYGIVIIILGLCTIGTPILAGVTTGFVALSFGIFFTCLIAMFIAIHCWLIVYTQYEEMKVNRGSASIMVTPNEEL